MTGRRPNGPAPHDVAVQTGASGAHLVLKRRPDFLRVAKGLRRNWGDFSLQTAPAALGQTRVGLTITKAVGTATERNRIRRRLRAALRSVPALPTADFVVVARRSILGQDFRDLTQAIAKAMTQAASRLPDTTS